MFTPILSGIARLARQQAIPYVVCPHSPYHPELLQKNRLRKRLYSEFFERPLLNAARAVYLLSSSDEPYLRSFGVHAPVIVLPKGFDPHVAPAPVPAGVRTENDIRLLFLGRLDAHTKGLDLLITGLAQALRAAKLPQTTRLRLAGPDWGSRAALEKMATRLGIRDHLEFAGPVSRIEKWEHLAWADLVVLTSRFEGFPMVIVEAMAASRPVLLSAEAGISEIVQAADCGFITPPAAGDIADTLATAVNKRAIWAAMGERGRRYANQHLRWDRIADEALQQFTDLLPPPADRPPPAPVHEPHG
jgi:glycosyltransferase involved in cell wall biosynthesis